MISTATLIAIFCFITAAVALLIALLSSFANHMGGASSPESVNPNRPLIYLLAAVVFFALAIYFLLA